MIYLVYFHVAGSHKVLAGVGLLCNIVEYVPHGVWDHSLQLRTLRHSLHRVCFTASWTDAWVDGIVIG